MPTCKECNIVFYSQEGFQVHVEKVHNKPNSNSLDAFAQQQKDKVVL
ncbi:MAG: hypothetical protein KGH87_07725 [Thaumarchaeota archaeon]|nr:hypothetical protein [Nitrososphaerota archaeon]MDH2907272.1 hypothetical protein [Candidatus Nitrosotalea sp.]